MLLLLLPLSALAAAALEVEVSTECSTCFLANTTCYNVSNILTIEAPFRNKIVIHKIGVQRSQNRLYYSFEPVIEDKEYYKVGFVDLDSQNVSGIINAQSPLNFGTFDFDQDNEVVYFGGSDGVFALDTKANKLSPYSSRGDSIRSLFYKNHIFFSKHSDLGIVSKVGDGFKTLLEHQPVENFVITKYDVIVFSNRYGLHLAKNDGKIFGLSRNAFFRGIVKDLDDNVYAWWIDGIYKVIIDKNLHYSKLVKYADIDTMGAMAFDNDNNIIFTVDASLFRMTPTDKGCVLPPSADEYFD